jgi:hypothetical protein
MWQFAHHPLTRKQQRIRTLSRQSWGAWALLAGVMLVVWGGAAGYAWWMIRKASASDRLPPVTLEAHQDLTYDLWKFDRVRAASSHIRPVLQSDQNCR